MGLRGSSWGDARWGVTPAFRAESAGGGFRYSYAKLPEERELWNGTSAQTIERAQSSGPVEGTGVLRLRGARFAYPAALSDCLIRQGKVCNGNVENAQAGAAVRRARERFPHFHCTGGYDGIVVVRGSEAMGRSWRRASRALALSRIRSLWARATRITFLALPAAARRWEKAAKSGW